MFLPHSLSVLAVTPLSSTLLIPWSLSPLLLPPLHSKVVHFTISHAWETRKKQNRKDCLPCFEVLYRKVLDFRTAHELPSSSVSQFRKQFRTASRNVEHCRHCFVGDVRSECACQTWASWNLDHLRHYSLPTSLASCTHSNADTCDFFFLFFSFRVHVGQCTFSFFRVIFPANVAGQFPLRRNLRDLFFVFTKPAWLGQWICWRLGMACLRILGAQDVFRVVVVPNWGSAGVKLLLLLYLSTFVICEILVRARIVQDCLAKTLVGPWFSISLLLFLFSYFKHLQDSLLLRRMSWCHFSFL